jgi:hypothetical protein
LKLSWLFFGLGGVQKAAFAAGTSAMTAPAAMTVMLRKVLTRIPFELLSSA